MCELDTRPPQDLEQVYRHESAPLVRLAQLDAEGDAVTTVGTQFADRAIEKPDHHSTAESLSDYLVGQLTADLAAATREAERDGG